MRRLNAPIVCAVLHTTLLMACQEKPANDTAATTLTDTAALPTDDTSATTPADTATTPSTDRDGDGWAAADGDCDDDDPERHPEAIEDCDEIDDDCDGRIDEESSDATQWFADSDGDSFGDPEAGVTSCEPIKGHVADDSDCDDTNADINPDATDDPSTDVGEDCSDGGLTYEVIRATSDCSRTYAYGRRTGEAVPVHALGVYEARGTSGVITVEVKDEGPMTLVLTSYEAINWEVTEETAGAVESIIVTGYEGSSVTNGTTASVYEHLGSDRLSSSAYEWDDPDTRLLEEGVLAVTGKQLESHHGCYNPSSFVIEPATEYPDSSAYPDCDAAWKPAAFTAPDTTPVDSKKSCSSVVAESPYCLTLGGGQVKAIGMETGASCNVTATTVSSQSLAWMGEHLYFCDESNYDMLTRLSLTTGDVEKSYLYCSALTAWDNQLMLYPDHKEPHLSSRYTHVFDAFEEARCGKPIYSSWDNPVSESQATVGGDTLYTAWHSTDEIERYSLPGMTRETALPLEDFDGWIYGIAVLDDLLIANTTRYGDYTIFDASTGDFLDSISTSSSTNGMVCVAP